MTDIWTNRHNAFLRREMKTYLITATKRNGEVKLSEKHKGLNKIDAYAHVVHKIENIKKYHDVEIKIEEET